MRWSQGSDSASLAWVATMLFLVVPPVHLVWYLWTPWRPASPAETAWIGIAVFYGSFFAVGTVGSLFLAGRSAHVRERIFVAAQCHAQLVTLLLAVSLCGLALHLYAKAPLLASSNWGCLGELRGAYLNSHSAGLDGGRQVASATGHLLANFYAPGLFLGVARLVSHGWARRTLWFTTGFLVTGIVYASVMVSRSVLLTSICVAVLGAVFGYVGRHHRGAVGRAAMTLAVMTVVLAGISISVFSSKIKCGAGDGNAYVASNARAMPIVAKHEPTGEGLSGTSVKTACATCMSTLLYLNHGIYNFVQITATEGRGDPVLFGFARYWGERLGILEKQARPGSRVYAAGGATLPGAAYHDFGWSGTAFVGATMGALLVWAIWLIGRGGSWQWFGIAGFVVVGIGMMEGLLFVAPATLSFPFILTAFLVVALAKTVQSRFGRL